MAEQLMLLWHPDSPGMRVPVRRGWIGRLLKPAEFATFGEVLAFYRALDLANYKPPAPGVPVTSTPVTEGPR